MNSIIRPRRLRRTEAIREMVRENHLRPEDFIYPLFIHEEDFKEEISAMPVFLPIVLALGFDPIWFGILFCVNMQVSFLSPPFGPAAFYLKSVAPPHISLTDIFRGFAPFIVIQLIVLACVMFFPEAMTQNFHEFKPKP